MTTPAPTVVIALGNPMRHDDGAGIAVAAELADGLSGVDVVALDGEPTRVIEAWRDRVTAVVVDAVVTGAPAGTLHQIEVGPDGVPRPGRATSSHGDGIAEAIALGRALDRMPGRLVVLGVEPADVSPGPGLSPAVEAAVPALVERIRATVAP